MSEPGALEQAAANLIADWDDHFDAEGPLEDGRYRWSSAIAAEQIEALRAALLKGTVNG